MSTHQNPQGRRIVGIVGLPGSGKSFLMQEYFFDPYSKFIAIDDMGNDLRWKAKDGELFSTAWGKTIALARMSLAMGCDVVLADVELCQSGRRELIQSAIPAFTIEWRFFANDPEQCIANVRKRNRPNGRADDEVRKIKELAKQYSLPSWQMVMPVYRPENTSARE